MKRIRKIMGVGLASASLVGCKPAINHKPYKDSGINEIYNLLFCDSLSLFQKKFTGDISYPWDVLFSSKPNIEELRKIASDKSQEGRVRMLAYNRLRDMNQTVPEKELLGVIIEVAFGEILKKYRLQAGLSQNALAKRAGMHCTTISYYEVGRRKPTIHTLFILSRALELKPEIMISDLREMKPDLD